MNITDLSIKRPLAVSMVFLAVIIFGLVSLSKLAIDLFPNITFPVMIVMANYPGAGPEEIETTLTDPLEKTLSTVNNLDKITSQTLENTVHMTLQFAWGTDLDAAANDVRDRLGLVTPYLPKDASKPLIFKLDPSMEPVVMYTIAGDIDPLELQDIADDVSDKLQRVDGVAASYTEGGAEKEVQIIIDPVKAAGIGINAAQLTQILTAQNLNYPLGKVEQARDVYIIRLVGQYKNLDEIRNTVIGNKKGLPILLSQIAEVKFRPADKEAISRTNGVASIWGLVQKRTDANTVNVCNKTIKALGKIQKGLPPGVKLNVVYNQADFINRSIKSTANTLVVGAILAVIVLFIFLGNLRATFFVAIGIPITVFFTLFLMFSFRMTLNIISLGGLTVAIGMVVDSAIVVFEAIYRHREDKREKEEAASLGTKEVRAAITASTLTTIAVFLPLLLIRGFASIFFNQLALTVTFALISSLVVALTIIPMLSSRFLKFEKEGDSSRKFRSAYKKIEELYKKIIRWALHHRLLVISGSIALLIVSLFLTKFIGKDFMPDIDRAQMYIKAEMPLGTNLSFTDSAVTKLEKILLREVPEIKALSTTIGTGSGFTSLFSGGSGPNSATIMMTLVHRENRKRSIAQIQHSLRPHLDSIAGLKVSFATQQFQEMFLGGKPIEIKISGYDLNESHQFSVKLIKRLKKVKGLVDIESSFQPGKPEFQLRVDRQKAARFGLTPYQIGGIIRARIAGVVASQFRSEGDEYDIRLRWAKKYCDNLDKIKAMTVTTPAGEIPLRNFLMDTITVGPATIDHENNERIIKISANVEGRDLNSVARDVQKVLKNIEIPPKLTVQLGGGFEQMQTSFQDFGFIILLAVFLVYIIMVGQFESFKEPFVIIFTIPLAIIGVLWMLFFSNTTINLESLLGILLLGGIVVNNAIVYVDYTNQLRRFRKMPLIEAVVEAGRVRLRPILMTAFTTIFGLIPMALALGAGNELRAPMARSVIGGLLVSTFLTLVFIPVLYTIVEKE